jgi:hypothetical protein
MPVLGGGDLRSVRFLATSDPSQELPGFASVEDGKQEVANHRHSITTKNKTLDVGEVEGGG